MEMRLIVIDNDAEYFIRNILDPFISFFWDAIWTFKNVLFYLKWYSIIVEYYYYYYIK